MIRRGKPAVHEQRDDPYLRGLMNAGKYTPTFYGYECLKCRYKEERSEFDPPPRHDCPVCDCEFWVLVGRDHIDPFREGRFYG